LTNNQEKLILRFLICFAGALLLSFCATAQDNVVAGYVLTGSSRVDHLAGRRDPIPVVQSSVLTIPLKRSGKLLLIEAEVDGVVGNFIFDTGAPFLVLNQTYFRSDSRNSRASVGGITGGSNYQLSRKVEKLTMRGLEYLDINADLTPLGHIEDARGVKILGLLGLNLFKAFEIELDVQNNELILRTTDRSGAVQQGSEFTRDLVHPIKVSNNAIFVEGMIAGRRLSFVLDTGAETNTLSADCGKKVMETISIKGRSQLMGTGARKVEVLFGEIRELMVGAESFSNMKTLITNMGDMSTAYGTSVDGMLGYDFLARGKVRINFVKNTIEMEYFDIFKSSR
jgi:predicted aspartyl protease